MTRATPRAGWLIGALSAALFTPTVVFISAANNVILRNLVDVPYSWETVSRFLYGFACGVLVSLPIFAVADRWRTFAFLTRGILLIGSAVLLFDSVSGLTQGGVDRLVVAVLLDVAVLITAGLIVFLPSVRVLTQVFGVVAPVLLLYGVATHARVLWQIEHSLDEVRQQAFAKLRTSTPRVAARRGNIYHVVLDGFQREAYEILTAKDPTLRPDGLTYFSRFTAGYFLTFYSLPHVLTGRTYREGESFHGWQHEASSAGVWGDLAVGGIDLTLYPYWDSYCSPLARECYSTVRAMADLQHSATERLLVNLWFLNLLPRSVRSVVTGQVQDRRIVTETGAGIIKNNTPSASFAAADMLLPGAFDDEELPGAEFLPWRDLSTLAGVADFERMLAEESDRPGQGQYVFVHTMVPHHPYVVDSECRYKGPGSHPPDTAEASIIADSYLAQAKCGLRLVGKLVERLRALGRFQDALIIVHGDHGMETNHGGNLMSRYPEFFTLEKGNGDDEEVLSNFENVGIRSHALLLVKFPGATGFTVSPRAAQMIDLAPTILAQVGLPTENYPGVLLQNMPDHLDREIAFFAGAPALDFFRLGDLESDLVFPSEGRFNKFVLDDNQWRYRSDVPVM